MQISSFTYLLKALGPEGPPKPVGFTVARALFGRAKIAQAQRLARKSRATVKLFKAARGDGKIYELRVAYHSLKI